MASKARMMTTTAPKPAASFVLIPRFFNICAPRWASCGSNVSFCRPLWMTKKKDRQFSWRSLGSYMSCLLAALQARVGCDAHAQRVQLDEAAGVGLVVGAAVFVEGGDGHVEQRVGLGIARDDDHIALVEFDAHPAVDGRLRVVDQRLDGDALRRPPVAVVDHRRVARHQVVLRWATSRSSVIDSMARCAL